MKLLSMFVLFFSLSYLSIGYGQDRFRRDYAKLVVDAPEQPELDGTYYAHHVFVFNYNENGDMMYFPPKGGKTLFVRTSPVEEGQHDNGIKFSFFKALDEDGEYVLVKVFHKKRSGVQLFVTFEEKYDVIFHFKDDQ